MIGLEPTTQGKTYDALPAELHNPHLSYCLVISKKHQLTYIKYRMVN